MSTFTILSTYYSASCKIAAKLPYLFQKLLPVEIRVQNMDSPVSYSYCIFFRIFGARCQSHRHTARNFLLKPKKTEPTLPNITVHCFLLLAPLFLFCLASPPWLVSKSGLALNKCSLTPSLPPGIDHYRI